MSSSDYLLFTTGPVMIPERIRAVLNLPMISHRDPEFLKIYAKVIEGLKHFSGTGGYVIPLSASGTGGMEAAILNCTSAGDRVLVVDQGKFSSRWVAMCRILGLDVKEMKLSLRASIDSAQFADLLKHEAGIKAVVIVHCETSTGAINDIERLADVIRRNSDAIFIVDAISTFGVLPINMDGWGIDVVVFTSNKGLMNPPGVAFVALNDRAFSIAREVKRSYYFDFSHTQDSYKLGKGSPFTPAIPIFRGVACAVDIINEIGFEQFKQQHKSLANAFRTTIRSLDLKLWPENPSDSVTVIEMPAEIDAARVCADLKANFHLVLSKGQGDLVGKVIRVGHYGIIDLNSYNYLLSSLVENLVGYGYAKKVSDVISIFKTYSASIGSSCQ